MTCKLSAKVFKSELSSIFHHAVDLWSSSLNETCTQQNWSQIACVLIRSYLV